MVCPFFSSFKISIAGAGNDRYRPGVLFNNGLGFKYPHKLHNPG